MDQPLHPGGLDLAALAQEQRENQAQLTRDLQRALHNPHTVTEITTSIAGVAPIPGLRKIIIVALPTGAQIRLHLDGASARTVGEDLLAPHPEETPDPAPEDLG